MTMAFLLDTHIFLWWMENNQKLSNRARTIIQGPNNVIVISAVTILEISIKKALGKLIAPDNLEQELINNDFTPLAITIAHAQAVGHLPFHHNDPFDRLLIIQAQLENLTLLTCDMNIKKYEVSLADI